METITVDVAGKFGPKANGKWYGVKRPLKATDFVSGQTYNVETEAWNTNTKSGVNIVSILGSLESNRSEQKAVEPTSVTKIEASKSTVNTKDVPPMTYEEVKNRRILRQGVVQATIQSPLLAGLPFTNANDAVALVKDVANQLIEFVQE